MIFSPRFTDWLAVGCETQSRLESSKVLYKTLQKTISKGLAQAHAYMDRCGASEGNLVIFNRTPNRPWEKKIFVREEELEGKKIALWGM